MAGRTAGEIAANLTAGGVPADMPVVIGKAVTRPGETCWAGRLSELGDAMTAMGYDEPVLVGIGRTFDPLLGHSRMPASSDLAIAV
ncbi:MAG TPA: hypothetical protein VK862_21215 [Afifellaceae bacterium]|nr:hypothetical protein [Afifellaceae bacterium]